MKDKTFERLHDNYGVTDIQYRYAKEARNKEIIIKLGIAATAMLIVILLCPRT